MKTRRYGTGPDARRIYLIAPRHPRTFWSLQGTVDLFGATTLMPNSALATLMALTPEGVDVEYMLCDENVSAVDLEVECDLVAVTGSTLHVARIRELCGAFAARSVPVALGGTYASLCPEECDGLADHLFVGEAEYTWPAFLREWTAGEARPRYVQEEHVAMADSPPPDWSLLDVDDYLNLSVQTSRGCPNRCDFCDVIQYVGRRYRTKSVEQILAEVQNAHALGARAVFFSDDNFMGNKAFTRELLGALVEWNTSLAHPVSFSTQITVQVADDPALLRLFADARFSVLFVGLETTRRESLEEVHKGQNSSRDPVERIRDISRYGIVPFVGLIVGFDGDDAAVFDELDRFIEESRAPVAGISMLNAPRHTPLYERLEREGRLAGEDFSGEWQLSTNIIPKQMTVEELEEGYWRLFRGIYEPARFEARMRDWLEGVEYFTEAYTRRKQDWSRLLKIGSVLRYCVTAPSAVRGMFLRTIFWGIRRRPRLVGRIFTLLGEYRHFRDFVRQGAG
jgi:radical SAM superfamily enzyme YgiQ (UPF0313 family)